MKTPGQSISRLPAAIQEEVSRCLADGGTWREVSDLLVSHGYDGVNAQNVTNYRQGAHQKWLAKRERLNLAREKYAIRHEMLALYAAEGGAAEAGLATAMDVLEEALTGFEPSELRALMADKPGMFLSVVDRMIRLRATLADIRAERSAAAQAAAVPGEEKVGLSADELAKIEQAIENR